MESILSVEDVQPCALDAADEAAWDRLRKAQFPSRRISLNPGHLGPLSAHARACRDSYRHEELDFYPAGRLAAGYGEAFKALAWVPRIWHAPQMAPILSASTTDAMNLLTISLAGTLRRQTGRQPPYTVLTTPYEHPGGVGGFRSHPDFRVVCLTEREIQDVEAFRLGVQRESPDVAFYSHVDCVTCRQSPVEAWYDVIKAATPGCWVVLDCAQSLGVVAQVPLEQADVVVGSAHKWLFGPVGLGLMWFHPRARETLLPLSFTGPDADMAHPLIRYGFPWSRDPLDFSGLRGALELYSGLTPRTVAQRSRLLADHFRRDLLSFLERRSVVTHAWAGTQGSGAFTLDFHPDDPYPLYAFMNAQGVHAKCIKLTLPSGQTVAALRFGFPCYETLARLEVALDVVRSFYASR